MPPKPIPRFGFPHGFLPGPIPGPASPGFVGPTMPANLFPRSNLRWGDVVNVTGPFAGLHQGQVRVKFAGAPWIAPALTSAFGGSVIVPDGSQTGACAIEVNGRRVFGANCVITPQPRGRRRPAVMRPREPRGQRSWENFGDKALGAITGILSSAISPTVQGLSTSKLISRTLVSSPTTATTTSTTTKTVDHRSTTTSQPADVTAMATPTTTTSQPADVTAMATPTKTVDHRTSTSQPPATPVIVAPRPTGPIASPTALPARTNDQLAAGMARRQSRAIPTVMTAPAPAPAPSMAVASPAFSWGAPAPMMTAPAPLPTPLSPAPAMAVPAPPRKSNTALYVAGGIAAVAALYLLTR